jgi:hypothetical protein
MIVMTPDESRLWSLISCCHGRSEAIGAQALAIRTGLSDRMVRKIVKALIEQHDCPIASSPHPPAGYYCPETIPEISETLDSLRGRALSILTRMSRLRRSTLRETVDQLLLGIDEAA